jgi:hypothetical protein
VTPLLWFACGCVVGGVCAVVGLVSVVWSAITVAAEWETDEGAGE